MSDMVKRLQSQFNAALLTVETVRDNFFPHLSIETFKRRARGNDLGFPVICTDRSQKAAMFVHVDDLAAYLDSRRAEAKREHQLLSDARA